MTNLLWHPGEERVAHSLVRKYMDFLGKQYGRHFDGYKDLHQWSVLEKEMFWSSVWTFCSVIGEKGDRILENGEDIERARWFPDARLNFAENMLRRIDEAPAIIFRAEDKVSYSLSFGDLCRQVAAVSTWLRSIGIQPGDRIAGYLPNMPETIVAMLASAAVGAVWTSTSPDFGHESVLDRFGQTAPRVLFHSDGYYYNGKTIDILDRVEKIVSELDSVHSTVLIPLIHSEKENTGLLWQEILDKNSGAELEFTPMGFNDPLCILYSSGTTGMPKCITHTVGGVLLQHLKEHQLHCDIKRGDKVFYFTTCGWMMWNWLLSVLGSRATVVLYDGSPFYPKDDVLWQYADDVGLTLFGTSAKYIDTMKKRGLRPVDSYKLSCLKIICSTGSVLAPESYDYVYEAIKKDVCLASISGGTDIISCFVLGSPILPVYRGECQCRGLGMAVEVFDPEGDSLLGEKGELVCTATFPCQPVYFWNDPEGIKYHKAYFSRYKNIWHHGDYVKLTENGGLIFYGRSDATLNPGGVRIGTAEIYRHVEQVEEVLEAIVVGQDWDNDVRVVLFVVLQPGLQLNEELVSRIKMMIRDKCSPRHVPAKVIQVSEIPRTKSGKIVELAVRQVVHKEEVLTTSLLANPEALDAFRDLAELEW